MTTRRPVARARASVPPAPIVQAPRPLPTVPVGQALMHAVAGALEHAAARVSRSPWAGVASLLLAESRFHPVVHHVVTRARAAARARTTRSTTE